MANQSEPIGTKPTDQKQINACIALAHARGWDGVSNSKLLSDFLEQEFRTLEKQLLGAQQETFELRRQMDGQHERTKAADNLWRVATGNVDTFPDLSMLIDWLILRTAIAVEAERKRCLDILILEYKYWRECDGGSDPESSLGSIVIGAIGAASNPVAAIALGSKPEEYAAIISRRDRGK